MNETSICAEYNKQPLKSPWEIQRYLDMKMLRQFIYFLDNNDFQSIDPENITVENCKKALSLFQCDKKE